MSDDIDIAIAIARARGQRKPLGTRIMENIVGDDDPTTQNFGERVGTLMNMAGEAMTFGLVGDEASAAVSGAAAAAIPGGRGFREAYESRRDYERGQQAMMEERNPGLSLAAQVGGALLGPAGVVRGVGQAARIGAAGGAAYGAAEGEGGASSRATSGLLGGAIGAAGGAASVPIARAVQSLGPAVRRVLAPILRDRRMFDGRGLTESGRETLEAMGYNVDELSEAFAREFQRSVDRGMEPGQGAAAAELGEFGIPALRANVTGSADDFAALERARRGALGDATRESVVPALDSQQAAMRGAADDIATRLGGGVAGDQGDAAAAAMASARSARDASRGAAGQAYDALEVAGGGVRGTALNALGTRLARAVQVADNFTIDAAMTPNAAGAVRYLDSAFNAGREGAVPFMQIERARQMLVRQRSAAYRGSVGMDQQAMDRLLANFDDQVDQIMQTALTEGDGAVISAAKEARGLWSAYKERFLGDGAASRFIQDMVDADATPDDVARWLFSSGQLGTGRFNSTIAKGLRETLDEGAWNSVRQGAFRQLVQRPEGTAQPGPQAISQNISRFLNSPTTRELSRELFAPDEIATMKRYAQALQRLVPPQGAVNYSNTAYESARLVREGFRAMAGMLGMAGGGVGGGVAGTLAVGAGQRGRDWLTTRAILSAAPPRGASQAASRAAGVVGGNVGVAAEETYAPRFQIGGGVPQSAPSVLLGR